MLFVAPPQTVSSSLLRALQGEFPSMTAEHVGSVASLCQPFGRSVAFVAIHARIARSAEQIEEELRRWHRDAVFVLMDHGACELDFPLSEILESRLIRSVLPMNVRLDIWLSIVELLLRGGDYLPASFLRGARQMPPQARTGDLVGGSAPPHAHRSDAGKRLAELTRREHQILAILAKGMQNKAIAARLGLSEHTVKVHVHHIINKLGARNRTDAALLFREASNDGGSSENAELIRFRLDEMNALPDT